jgi:hypothetical protein
MPKLNWQRITDSEGATVMYTAVVDQPDLRQHYRAYRILPASLALRGTGDRWYTVALWQGDTVLARIGSVHDTAWGRDRRGEYKLADAKAAAQAHHSAEQAGV